VKNGELRHGKLFADVAAQEGVTHFVWSGLANSKEESNGKYKVSHFSNKHVIDQYAREKKFKYYTTVLPGFYFENWSGPFTPRANEKGEYSVTVPIDGNKPLGMFSIAEFGKPVVAALNEPAKWNGKSIAGYAGPTTASEAVALLSKASGKAIALNYVPPDVYSHFFKGAGEIAEMLGWIGEYGYFGSKVDLNPSKEFQFTTFEQFLEKHPPKF